MATYDVIPRNAGGDPSTGIRSSRSCACSRPTARSPNAARSRMKTSSTCRTKMTTLGRRRGGPDLMVAARLASWTPSKNLRQLLVCRRGYIPTSERRLEDMKRGEISWSDRNRGCVVLVPANASLLRQKPSAWTCRTPSTFPNTSTPTSSGIAVSRWQAPNC